MSEVFPIPGLSTGEAQSTKEILAAVSSALRRDRGQVQAMVAKAGEQLQGRARERAGDALARLRAVAGSTSATPRSVAADDPHGARLGPPAPTPPVAPRPVLIRRADGQWIRGRIVPDAVHREEVEALRRVVAANTSRAFEAIQQNARAIDELARSQRELAAIVAELQARTDPSLLDGLLDGLDGLRGKLKSQERTLASQEKAVSSVTTQQKAMSQSLRLQDRAAQIQKLTNAASSMQVAAFGEPGKLLSRRNVTLAANELLWSYSSNVLGALGFGTSALAWAAPVASLLTSQATVGQQQTQRFITGIASEFIVPLRSSTGFATIPLQDKIAKDLFPSFRTRTDVPVSVTQLGEPKTGLVVTGQVKDGVLTIQLRETAFDDDVNLATNVVVSPFASVRIAWMVDTGVGRA